jgi:hypothetical protein
MIIPAGNSLFVELQRSGATGAPWIVRLFRKRFFFRRNLSSDWFLEESQARAFAELLATELRAGGSPSMLRSRAPGWTLHRPAR